MLAILYSTINKNSGTCKLTIVFSKVCISMQDILNMLLRAYVVLKYTVRLFKVTVWKAGNYLKSDS